VQLKFIAFFSQKLYFCKKIAKMDYPILMADIIKSHRKDQKKLIHQFNELVATINASKQEHLISPLTITLGDEFQGVMNSMVNGIRTIFELEETILIKGYDLKLRYVLLFGKIDTEINRSIAYGMLGEGLTQARKNLITLKKKDTRFTICLNPDEKNQEDQLNKAFLIYQNTVDAWKEKDQAIVKEFLHHDDYKIVAQHVNIDPSNAWRRKKSLAIQTYYDIKSIISFLLTS
jgi:hypothetical protein